MPLGHVGVNVPNLGHAKQYFDTVMPLRDYEPFLSGPDEFAYKPAEGKVGTYILFYPSRDGGEYSRHRTGLQHLAFMVMAPSRRWGTRPSTTVTITCLQHPARQLRASTEPSARRS